MSERDFPPWTTTDSPPQHPRADRRSPARTSITIGLYDHDLHDASLLTLRGRIEEDLSTTGENSLRATSGPRPALVLLNDGDFTYAKIRFDAESLRNRPHQPLRPPRTPSPARSPGTPSATPSATANCPPPPTWTPPAPTSRTRRTSPSCKASLAFASAQVTDRYLTPEARPAALATLTDLCRDLIRRTEDGSNPGSALASSPYATSSTSPPTPTPSPPGSPKAPSLGGPELDPELRWRVLARLAVLGATEETAIAAELARDPSATGQEGAARCRAALPDPEAKRTAWEAMFTTDDLSNYLFTATAQGFWQPEQADLVREYVPRFYEDAVTLARPPRPRHGRRRRPLGASPPTPSTPKPSASARNASATPTSPRPAPQARPTNRRPGKGVASPRGVGPAPHAPHGHASVPADDAAG
ncbi:ERAP1-like C-terminal domain-containing protein [Streptomyces sp. L7]